MIAKYVDCSSEKVQHFDDLVGTDLSPLAPNP